MFDIFANVLWCVILGDAIANCPSNLAVPALTIGEMAARSHPSSSPFSRATKP